MKPERVYDSEEELYYLRPKPQTESIPKTESKPKDNIKDTIKRKANPATKPITKTEDSIYLRIKYECKECHEEFQ